MGTIPEMIAGWRAAAGRAEANADGCDEFSRARNKHAAYMASAAALRTCADQLEAWWMAMSEGVIS